MQCTFWARQYAVTPAQLVEWWPDIDLPGRRKQVRQQQWTYQAAFDRWSNRGTQDLRGWDAHAAPRGDSSADATPAARRWERRADIHEGLLKLAC